MKKLMIALAVVAMAAVSQAAMVKWSGTIAGVDVTKVTDNGDYAASGSALSSGLSYALTIFDASTGDVVYTKSAALTTSTPNLTFSSTNIKASHDYTWQVVVSGAQADLRAKTSTEFDYSAATIATTLSGEMTTLNMGTTTFSGSPTSWTVSGITAAPEPTSGLLLLLGVGALALRRRRA